MDDEWKKFWSTGTVADYLRFKNAADLPRESAEKNSLRDEGARSETGREQMIAADGKRGWE